MSVIVTEASFFTKNTEPVYSVRMREGMSYFWHIISVKRNKESLLMNATNAQELDIKSLGTILESGWGINIPQGIKDKYSISDD